jgi:hypothetical protein
MSDVELADLFGDVPWEAIEQRHQAFVEEAEAGGNAMVAARQEADWESLYLFGAERNGKRPRTKALNADRVN